MIDISSLDSRDGCLRANTRAKTVSVSAVASPRAVFRCANESFMLMNNTSREKG